MMNKVTGVEYEGMKAIWEIGGVATSREIFDRVQEKKTWSKTTVKALTLAACFQRSLKAQ